MSKYILIHGIRNQIPVFMGIRFLFLWKFIVDVSED